MKRNRDVDGGPRHQTGEGGAIRLYSAKIDGLHHGLSSLSVPAFAP